MTATDAAAVFRDGTSSRKRNVTLRFADTLQIFENGAFVESWPYDDIRRADDPHGLRVSCVSARPLARLEVDDAAAAQELVSRCRFLDVAASGRQTWRIIGWSLAAGCSILLVSIYGIPLLADRLAPFIPVALEKRIGEGVDTQVRFLFGGKACDRPDGQAAFNVMMEKLREAGGITLPLQAEVLSSSVPNAIALPGGKVYLFDGLLQKARNPDEIAGVLAHELGHVQHRDSLRKVIQTGGTSFLIGLLFGDVTGGSAVIFAARSIIDASYSRESERDADDFAVATMRKLGRSARPMGEFLVRVTTSDGKSKSVSSILDSHPVSEERLARMTQEGQPNTGPDILSAAQWRALKEICKAK
jgi:Zn-dependent protease with chaperone function